MGAISPFLINGGSAGAAGNLIDNSATACAADTIVAGVDGYTMPTFASVSGPNLGLMNPFSPTPLPQMLLAAWIKPSPVPAPSPGHNLTFNLLGSSFGVIPSTWLSFTNSNIIANWSPFLGGPTWPEPATISDGNYHHLLMSLDLTAQQAALAFDGTIVAGLTITATPGGSGSISTTIQAEPSNGFGDYWFGFTPSYESLSADLIAKFIQGGKPVSLGADGSGPGLTPLLYYSGNGGPAPVSLAPPPIPFSIGSRNPSPIAQGVR